MLKEKLRLPYELLMVSLAVTVAVLVTREFLVLLTPEEWRWHRILNLAILAVFAADYFTRLFLAKDKRLFLKRHIPELVAIIPLDSQKFDQVQGGHPRKPE
jgi:voltage-gated potassium channel